MKNILHSMRLDYYILKSSDFRRILVVVAVALLAGGMSKQPPLILGIIMMIAGFFMGTVFAVIEKNNLSRLYGILPVRRSETVIGRYLFALLTGVVIAALASALTLAASALLSVPVSGFLFAVWLSGSFLAFCLVISVQFPLYFRYDFSKLAAYANLPYVVVLIGGSYLIKKDPQLFASLVTYFTANPAMLWVAGIVTAVVLLVLSAVVSVVFYRKREL